MYKISKRILIMLLPLLLLLVQFLSPINARAVEANSAETRGSIGFTGIYEPIGVPDPVPPVTEIAKPVERLPQTNEINQSWISWFGLSVMSLSLVLFKRKRKNKQNKKNNKEVGIII